jgi:hypothetical protein
VAVIIPYRKQTVVSLLVLIIGEVDHPRGQERIEGKILLSSIDLSCGSSFEP